jgi:adenosylmethionine-8-amino-7-oxononanoate aminotransferase
MRRRPVVGVDWTAELGAFEAQHVWHPYAPLPAPAPALPVVGAAGVRLRLADGRELIDGMSSWWCAVHGYRHPALDAAVRGQLERMAHVMFGGLTHPPAAALARRLCAMAPEGLDRVFLCDSGSVSVEVAIKLCLQWQRARGAPQRSRLLSLRGGYHGDTLGAMSVCDPIDGMHRLFAGALPAQLFGPRPPDGFAGGLDPAWALELERLAEAHEGELAALIAEPVVQGAGGMRFHSPACVAFLRELCDRHGMLLVLDEIATGFGRTGALFACEHAGVAPDVMCVGKALTGGYLSLAATICTRSVAETVSAGEGGALMHGPTYMGNPLACAAGLASTELLRKGGWRTEVARIERGLWAGLEPARELRGVRDVRVLGAIGVVELEGPLDVGAATAAAVAAGVWLRPFRNLIYTMPAYVMGDEELAALTAGMLAAARAASGARAVSSARARAAPRPEEGAAASR